MPKQTEPIQEAVPAKPHRPVYRMHRYFARRPYSVFSNLVCHYSEPGDVILDPFCGGGVTLVEGVLQQRRMIGFDINPLATFITRMELRDVALDTLASAMEQVFAEFQLVNDHLFRTLCRACGEQAVAHWFEYSAVTECEGCSRMFRISAASKQGIGSWACPNCGISKRFSSDACTLHDVIAVSYTCRHCGSAGVVDACEEDATTERHIETELSQAEQRGLWLPDEAIPDCNMQRESALFRKGIHRFRQLFTPRHLLALGLLREALLTQQAQLQDWLLFAFSSTLRYTNRMVTRNPAWRGDRPLEWAKPGFWLPPVHLEANVLEEFRRRCDAILRGKRDYLRQLPTKRPILCNSADDVISNDALCFHVEAQSATSMPIGDKSVDTIITDPPYGSYVHYADLCNFWSVWLPEIEGLGRVLNTPDEAVIARKRFPGAKSVSDYQRILEQCFSECARVLKDGGYMVMTFHNREPRAWAALLIAAAKAGFDLPADGIVFQDGIPSYKHTAQTRRAGSVLGDFILSFRKATHKPSAEPVSQIDDNTLEEDFVAALSRILEQKGPMSPDALMESLYLAYHGEIFKRIQRSVVQGDAAVEKLLTEFDAMTILDSHRRQLLERHFKYEADKWHLRTSM